MSELVGAVLAFVVGFAVGIADAEAARRFGGGQSFGTQRDSVRQQQVAPSKPAQAPQAAPGAPASAPAAAGASRWLGPIAGLLAGGLFGALLFGGAFEGFKFVDFAMILLLAGAVLFTLRMLRNPPPPQQRTDPMRYASADSRVESTSDKLRPDTSAEPAPAPLPAANYFPSGFDPDAFAAQAKLNFIRLQEANDRADVSAMRDVMTSEFYKEIESQVRERDGAAQKIEVVELDANVVEVITQGDNYIASVRFDGTIKEDAGEPEPFSEIWHLQKPLDGSAGWQIVGIQQD